MDSLKNITDHRIIDRSKKEKEEGHQEEGSNSSNVLMITITTSAVIIGGMVFLYKFYRTPQASDAANTARGGGPGGGGGGDEGGGDGGDGSNKYNVKGTFKDLVEGHEKFSSLGQKDYLNAVVSARETKEEPPQETTLDNDIVGKGLTPQYILALDIMTTPSTLLLLGEPPIDMCNNYMNILLY